MNDPDWMTDTLVTVVMTPDEWAMVAAMILSTGHPERRRLFNLIADAVGQVADRD
jgi:hypothetical protein